MPAIIKLSQNDSVNFFYEKGLNPTQQNSRWLPSSSWVRMNKWSLLYKMAESKMVKIKMAEFQMAAIIKLIQNKWVKFFSANGGEGSVSEVYFLYKWWKPILASVSEFERKYYDGWIQDCQIQDGCHHEVRWEWKSLGQIELVWVSIRVEWECFWVNLREDNKVSESKMAVSESNMAEFKMAAIIKLSQNEWVKFFVQNGWIQDGQIQDGRI